LVGNERGSANTKMGAGKDTAGLSGRYRMSCRYGNSGDIGR